MATSEVETILVSSMAVHGSFGSRALPQPIQLFGMPLHPLKFKEAVSVLLRMARGTKPAYAVTANVDHVIRFSRVPEVRFLYTDADLVVADGMPLIWASSLLGTPLPERVAGSDLLPAICAAAAEQELSVFLLGGAPGAAEDAVKVLRDRHPVLKIAGYHVPPYGFESDPVESEKAIEAVRAARPDILFVGLGSPKQEKWIVANKETCGAKLSIGVGISFSFVAGHIARAPKWMQRLGLEWVHRLWQEPGRLWKRYLIDDMAFVSLTVRQLLRRSSARDSKVESQRG